MSCCGNHNHETHQHHRQGGKHNSHKWLMIICCVLPVALAAIFFLAKSPAGTAGNLLPLFLILLCPLSHLVLMPFMMKRNKDHM